MIGYDASIIHVFNSQLILTSSTFINNGYLSDYSVSNNPTTVSKTKNRNGYFIYSKYSFYWSQNYGIIYIDSSVAFNGNLYH